MITKIVIQPAVGGFICTFGGFSTVIKSDDDLLTHLRLYIHDPDRYMLRITEEAVEQHLYPKPPSVKSAVGYAETAPPPTHSYPNSAGCEVPLTSGLATMSIAQDAVKREREYNQSQDCRIQRINPRGSWERRATV